MSEGTVMSEDLRQRIRLGQATDLARRLLQGDKGHREGSVVRMAAELAGEDRGVDPAAIENRILEGRREAERHLSDPSRYIKGPLFVEEVDPRDLGFKMDVGEGR